MKLKILLFLLISSTTFAQKKLSGLTFSANKSSVETYHFWEGSFNLKKAIVQNPFTEVKLTGTFVDEKGVKTVVDGFCDDSNGLIFKIRFMPSSIGKYNYSLSFSTNGKAEVKNGEFEVTKSDNQGVLRVDKENPWHFITDGNEKHFFGIPPLLIGCLGGRMKK